MWLALTCLSLPRITCDLQVHDHPDARVLFGEPFAFDGESIETVELTIPR